MPLLLASAEWRNRLATSTYVLQPRRGRVLATKTVFGALAGLLGGALLWVVPLPLVLLSPTAHAWTPSGLLDALARQQPAAAELPPAPAAAAALLLLAVGAWAGAAARLDRLDLT